MSTIKLICPAPPDILSTAPNILVLKKATCLFRVHHDKFHATAFNPGLGQPGRFSPIADSKGKNIPTLYTGNSINSALAESVFRNIVSTSPVITRHSLQKLKFSQLQNSRDLNLIDLTQNGLRRLGFKRNQLLESEHDNYLVTARWAEKLHDFNHEIDGMIWVSTQFDTEKSIVLFGDRISTKDLLVSAKGEPLYDNSGFEKVMKFASDAGITIFL